MPNMPASTIGKFTSTTWNLTSALCTERITSPRVRKLPDWIPVDDWILLFEFGNKLAGFGAGN